jgi:hypothetical protein
MHVIHQLPLSRIKATFSANHNPITIAFSKVLSSNALSSKNHGNNPMISTSYVTMDTWESDFINDCDPRLLSAKSTTSKYNNDNPSYKMAMHGPFQAEYYEAM